MNRKLALISILLGILLIAGAIFVVLNPEMEFSNLSSGQEVSGSDEIKVAPEIGAYAPDFSLLSLNDEPVQLNDYRGKVVLLNFWAVWCPPCRQEMPSIQLAYEQFNPELVVLSVNAGDSKVDTIDFKDNFGLTFEIVLDSEYAVEDKFRVRGLPTTFLIDPEGIIQVVHVGYMDDSQLNGYLAQLGVIK